MRDDLTTSTVLPRLEVLQGFPSIEKIILVTIERNADVNEDSLIQHLNKVLYLPLTPKKLAINIATKISDFLLFPRQLTRFAQRYNTHVLLAHGAPAGALAYKVWKRSKLPFYVSSFEPHADYMLESKVWTRYSLKYKFQKYWEHLQKKNAAGIMPVAYKYKNALIGEGVVAEKIFVVPCSVDASTFSFDEQKRSDLRLQLGWQHTVIGVYAGKYGGLYYQEDAFTIYKQCFESVPDFRLIILSPQPQEEIQRLLQQYQLDVNKVYIASVPHQEVPAYLSAADFAFATYKPGPSKKYLSPVKIGEYWANGLPVLLTEGVGDDSDIIKNEGGGATFNLQQEGSVEKALQQIQQILNDPVHRQEIPKLAQKYRSPERIREAYEYFFGQKQEEQP
ncbi:glycosyltransferase [Pontibacter pamirensis]|uniref:glycosyltransferase n=1 Tax=Pontibacter pamirensis TaxID=2562824 RepID=UPI00138A6059|nr:glycosyltransferase [Pontibacter pamirensis]